MNAAPAPCVDPIQNPAGSENAGCISGDASSGAANIIDPGYRTPYAIHISAGIQHAFNANWSLSADYVHELDRINYERGPYIIPTWLNLVDGVNRKISGFSASHSTYSLNGYAFDQAWIG